MTDRRRDIADGRPFSRPIDIDDVPEEGLVLRIEATPEECAAVAAATGLAALGSLVVDYDVRKRSHGRYAVHGKLEATITQICVVSLEPFESAKVQEIDLAFAPTVAPPAATPRSRRRQEHDVEPPRAVSVAGEEMDPPDPIIDGKIDLGAVAVEFLTLAQDLYPRKPGVQFTDMVTGEATEEAPSAFAALGRLKDRL